MGGEGGEEKLRRSRRLSSTRGLKAPGPNFDNEKISVSGESNSGLENRRKPRENGSSCNKPGLELLNVSGFPREEERKYRGNFRVEIDLTRRSKIDDVIKSDSKYEIGIPDGGFLKKRDGKTKEKGNSKMGKTEEKSGKFEEKQAFKSEKMEEKSFFRSVKTVEKSFSKAGKLEENSRGKHGKTAEKSGNFPRKNESTRTSDSIAKRLELIHELNQKILANYDKFQQRSRKYVDRKSTVNGQQSEIYAQVKRKCKTQPEKYSDSLKSRKIDVNKPEFSQENRSEGKEKKKKKLTSGCDVNENFRLAVKPEFPLLGDSNLRERITKAAYSIRSKSSRPENQGKLSKIFPAETEETLGNSKFYPGNSEENFDKNINCHGKSKFYSKISSDVTEKSENFEKSGKYDERPGKPKIFADNFSDVREGNRKIEKNTESLGKSKFPPENSSGFPATTKNSGKIPENTENLVDSKFSPKNLPVVDENCKNLEKTAAKTGKTSNFPRTSAIFPENRKTDDSSVCSEDSLEPETSCPRSPETSDLEREILRGLNATLAAFSRGKSGTSEEEDEEDEEKNEREVEKDELDVEAEELSCLSDEFVPCDEHNLKKANVGSCLDSSWDSGVGVDVGNGGGWVRIRTGIESSLVYLTLDTTAGDVCRDMLLGDDFALFLQYGGENGRRLASQEKPLELQDYFLQRIGYHHVSRRARLGVDPELRHLIAFHVGPACPAPEVAGYSRCGDTLVLKGLVFPQWKKRALAVLGSRLFLYPGCRESWPEWMELAGGAVCYAPSRLGKLVLRVTGFPRITRQGQQSQPEVEQHHPETRHVYLGFQHPWDRDLWKNWLKQATQLNCNPKKLDLSRAGLSRIPDSVVAFPAVEDIFLGQNQLSNAENNLAILQRFSKLSTVKLESNNLEKIPRDLLDLTGLTHLDLSSNKIEKISAEIHRLVNLKELILDGNLIKNLPDELGQLKNLKSISLVGNHIVRLPSFLTMRALTLSEVLPKDHGKSYKDEKNNQNNLQKINLRNNQLKGNIILGNYGNLTHLDVSENSIEKLDIGALQELKNVRCAKNLLTELTLCGRNLVSLIAGNNRLKKLSIEPVPVNLEHLDVSYNNLDALPEWTPDLPMLRALFASHNTLTALPDRLLSQPSRLEVLHLPHNRLQALPPPRRALNIVHLTLQGNALTTLPPSFFGNTEKMKVLNLSNNRLSELPYFCENNKNRASCHGLEKLYLTANCLTDTALDALAKFTALRTLHIAYNTLDTLPESCIASWSDLEELVLSGNRLQYLPDNVANLEHLRVLRVHSNRLLTCPTFSKTTSLKVLDLAHNQLDRVNLATLVPPQLQFLDISCNSRLHVDPRQFQVYRSQRPISLVDVSGQNRPSLPSHPQQQEILTAEKSTEQPWRLGFSETAGCREKLFVSQVRMPSFCNVEGLFGIFDGGSNQEAPSALQEMIPRLLLEERTVRETAKEYLKYTLLSAHRELKEKGQKYGIDATLLHLVKIPGTSGYPARTQRYCLRVASSGEAKAVLCRAAGPLTLAPPRKTVVRNQLGHAAMFPLVVPDPNLEEVALEDDDEFVIVANRRFWEVLSVEEAVREARAEASPVLAAKRLQDLAQAYGAEDNLSVIVLRLAGPGQGDLDQLMRELRHAVGKNRAQNEGNCVCPCCLPQNPHKPPGACCCHANEGYYLNGVLKNIVNRSGKPHNNSGRYFKNTRAIQDNESPVYRDDRSSPSGQSDQASDSTFKSRHPSGRLWAGSAATRATNKARQSVVMQENGTRKVPPCPPMQEDALSERSGGGLSEEQFRCWEYMLEQNTQLLFDKELDTLTRSPLRRGQSRSTPQLAGNLPFLSKRFGSARSFNPALPRPPVVRFGSGRRLLNGGPNAAYFGSLQRLMPYNLEYDFAVIQERAALDSLEQDASRMQQYWGVATTEL